MKAFWNVVTARNPLPVVAGVATVAVVLVLTLAVKNELYP